MIFASHLDSSSDFLPPTTADESSADADADVTAFDTDLPAAHNVIEF